MLLPAAGADSSTSMVSAAGPASVAGAAGAGSADTGASAGGDACTETAEGAGGAAGIGAGGADAGAGAGAAVSGTAGVAPAAGFAPRATCSVLPAGMLARRKGHARSAVFLLRRRDTVAGSSAGLNLEHASGSTADRGCMAVTLTLCRCSACTHVHGPRLCMERHAVGMSGGFALALRNSGIGSCSYALASPGTFSATASAVPHLVTFQASYFGRTRRPCKH